MDPRKITERVQTALSTAVTLAQDSAHAQLTPTHLAIALFEDDAGIARSATLKIGAEDGWHSIKRILRRRLDKLPRVTPPPDEVAMGKDLQKVRAAPLPGLPRAMCGAR